MFSKHVQQLGKVVMLVVVSVMIMGLAGAQVEAANECRRVEGRIILIPLPPTACASPVGICATGEYGGDIRGTVTFVGTSLTATADTPTSGVVLLNGDNTIQAGNGTLNTKDAIVLNTTGDGEFGEVDTVVGGTGAFSGATGVWSATGTFTASNGGEGKYQGRLCKV